MFAILHFSGNPFRSVAQSQSCICINILTHNLKIFLKYKKLIFLSTVEEIIFKKPQHKFKLNNK